MWSICRTALIASAIMVPLAAAETVVADKCPIECLNGAVCKKGDADYSLHPTADNGSAFPFQEDTNREGWFCDCPAGWTGIRCGREYAVCDDQDTNDPHYCYHGGQCLTEIADTNHIMKSQMYCDCSDAQHDSVPYVGKYCENKAEFCEPDNPMMSSKFCVNGGTCKPMYVSAIEPCDCPPDFSGPHCEFRTNDVPACDLTCKNGGKCQLGLKSYDNAIYDKYWESHERLQHCMCPEGFFGPRCGIAGTPCGDEHCFHDGKCVETVDRLGNKSFRCDCANENRGDETAYGGMHCQAKATEFCTAEVNANGRLFCTNGGTCKTSSTNGHAGCECLAGYTGPSCEFRSNVPVPEEKCSLTCENGGVCRVGFKDLTFNEQFGPELNNFDFNLTHNDDWEHCVCPDNYFGIRCEHEIQVCEGGEHVCLHGSQCVPINEGGSNGVDRAHQCDCDKGFDAVDRYAGKFCQYTSTDICTAHHKPGAGKANFAFCVNNGKCENYVDDNVEHPGCNCPDGFEGNHCEYLEGRAPKPSPTAGDDDADTNNNESENSAQRDQTKSKSGLIFGLVIAIIVVLVTIGIIVFVMIKRQRRNLAKAVIEEDADNNIAPTSVEDDLDAPKHGAMGNDRQSNSSESTISHDDASSIVDGGSVLSGASSSDGAGNDSNKAELQDVEIL